MQDEVGPEIDPLEEAYSRPCEPQRYGFYQFCDAAPAFCGSGVGAFAWFDTVDDMVDFLLCVDAESCMRKREGGPEVVAALAAARPGLPAGDAAMPIAQKLYNDGLAGHYKVEWIGKAADLIAGDSEYARTLRSEFRTACSEEDEEDDEAADGSPLADDEIEGFAEFLTDYGY